LFRKESISRTNKQPEGCLAHFTKRIKKLKVMIKMNYISPRMETTQIELEEGLAAGSATVRTPNASNQVTQEWQQDDTDYRVIEW
jgi:hypothetical protein